MRTDDRDIARLRIGVTLRYVLFHCQVKHFILRMSGGFGILAYMLCFHAMFLHVE